MNRQNRSYASRCVNPAEWTVEDSSPEVDLDFLGQRNSTMRTMEDSSLLVSMSFASLQIGECKPLEGQDEVDKKTFEQWRSVLEAAMHFAGITDEISKASIFKMKAGVKLLDILEDTPDVGEPEKATSPYSNIMRRLGDYYGSRDYMLLQRQRLRAMYEESNESDVKYVKRLASVAKLCAYKSEQLTETVTDVLQTHALNIKVREAARKIARKGGSIQELMDKVRVAEIEKQAEDLFVKNHPTQTVVEVNAVSNVSSPSRFVRGQMHQYRGRGRFQRQRGTFSRGGGISSTSRLTCWRCTSRYHRPDECFAMDKVCRACQTKGHLERACSKSSLTKRPAIEDSGSKPNVKTRKIAAITATGDTDPNEHEDKNVSVE